MSCNDITTVCSPNMWCETCQITVCVNCLSYAYTNLYPYMLAEKCVKYEMCLTNENVKQHNVYLERVCKVHCAVHCAMVEGAGRGLWACEEVTHGSEMNKCC